MTNLKTQADQFFKQSIISTIHLLEQKIDLDHTSFEKLNNQTYEQLEKYRDNLVNLYNKSFSIFELSKNL
jgi:hypothetical protein